jgi:hypothetical protein
MQRVRFETGDGISRLPFLPLAPNYVALREDGALDRLPLEPDEGPYACTGKATLWEVELVTSHISTLGAPSITFSKAFNTSG